MMTVQGLLSRRARRRTTPSPRGFTLVEVTVVVVISSILLFMMLRWIVALIGISAVSLEQSTTARDATYVAEVLAADTASARGCHPYGLDVPYEHIDTTSLGLYADVVDAANIAGTDGNPDLVMWQVAAGAGGTTIQRAVLVGDGDCDFDTSNPPWRVLASRVRATNPNAEPFFAGITEGAVASTVGPCDGLNAESCWFEAVRLVAHIDPPEADTAPVAIQETFPVNLNWSRLAPPDTPIP